MSLLLLGAGPSGSGSSEPVEEITNGDFETGALAPWTVNSGSCFVAEEAPFNVSCSDSLGFNANSRIQQTFSVESGSTYRVSYDASSTNSGQVEFTIGGVSATDPLVLSSFFQSRSFDVVATGSNALGIVIGAEDLSFTSVKLDNISVVKLAAGTPGDIFTSTPWGFAVDFNGGSEYLSYASTSNAEQAIKMGGSAVTTAAPSSSGDTSNDGNARPWATAIMFKSDGDSSSQDIWGVGQGATSGDDNVYLRQDSSGNLLFGWGREGFGYNEVSLGTVNSDDWYGVYIAHNGTRLSAVDATATNLAAAFDIRVMSSSDWDDLGSNYSTSSNWSSTGNAMDRAIIGDVFVGGRGGTYSFQGKVASYISTTLDRNVAMPPDAEIEKMIIDPVAWLTDYKVGETARRPNSYFTFTFALNDTSSSNATQVWLMGDGVDDSLANGVRNYVWTTRVQARLEFNNMVSDDIEAVTIPRLN